MGLSTAEINKALNALSGRAAYTASAAVYAKLHTGAPGSAGTSNASTDVARKLITWAAPSGGAIASSAPLSWTLALSGTEVLTHISFWDDVSGGNFLGDGALSASATMNNGEVFNISSGLTMTLSGTKWTDAVKNAVLNAWSGLSTMTASAGIFLKLHTGDPGAAGASNPATETTRKSITFGTNASGGSIANTATQNWTGIAGPTAPTTESITWGSIWDDVSGGNFLGRDDLTTARAISAGDQLDIAIGGLSLSIA